tara:strand:- start:2353 stop:2751 length:399 start_codon:yes stop_codon:yes gene_type:complete
MPPTRKGPATTSSNSRRIRTKLLEAAENVSAAAPWRSATGEIASSHASFLGEQDHERDAGSSSEPTAAKGEKHRLDFSCKKGCLVAVLAALEDSSDYGFWLAESQSDINKPKSEQEAKNMEIQIYYFNAVAG